MEERKWVFLGLPHRTYGDSVQAMHMCGAEGVCVQHDSEGNATCQEVLLVLVRDGPQPCPALAAACDLAR